MNRFRRMAREAAAVVGLLVGGAIIAVGAASLLTASEQADQTGSSAEVSVRVGNTAVLAAPLENVYPGAYRDQTVTVTNASTTPASLSYAVAGDGDQTITTDPTDGLRVRVWTCSVEYASGACTGTETEVTGAGATDVPNGSSATAWSADDVAPAGSRYLRIRVLLAATAPSSMQGQTFTVTHLFRATLPPGGPI